MGEWGSDSLLESPTSAQQVGVLQPVCDYAGYAPFEFGYRRCPGEQFTVKFVEDFLRKVWNDNIEFNHLSISNPEPVPVGPAAVVQDNIGFTRSN